MFILFQFHVVIKILFILILIIILEYKNLMSSNKVYKLSSNYAEFYKNNNTEINSGFLKLIERFEKSNC